MYVCVYVYVRTHTFMCVDVYVCIYTHRNTHTHTSPLQHKALGNFLQGKGLFCQSCKPAGKV